MRELRQHASRYLTQVRAGEVIEVTQRGTLVALLVPPTPAASGRDRLIASGRLSPAKGPFRLPERRTVTETGRSASAALAELRGERLA